MMLTPTDHYWIHWLGMFGLGIAILYLLIAFLCQKLWHKLSDDKKVWAIALWIFAMGFGSILAGALEGYQQGH